MSQRKKIRPLSEVHPSNLRRVRSKSPRNSSAKPNRNSSPIRNSSPGRRRYSNRTFSEDQSISGQTTREHENRVLYRLPDKCKEKYRKKFNKRFWKERQHRDSRNMMPFFDKWSHSISYSLSYSIEYPRINMNSRPSWVPGHQNAKDRGKRDYTGLRQAFGLPAKSRGKAKSHSQKTRGKEGEEKPQNNPRSRSHAGLKRNIQEGNYSAYGRPRVIRFAEE